jgi:GPH family glycoside/pentoside/hexuronide:cation symporter
VPHGAAGHERREPHSVLFAYAAPGFASSFLFTAVSLYLLKYSTDVLLMAPATVGLLFAVARFWDAVTDPLMGFISDRTRTRWGRRRPWLLVSVFPVALTYYAIWAPPVSLEGTDLTLWMAVAIIAFYTSVTVFAVPYSALGAELTEGYHERTRVFGAKAAGDQLGIIAAAGALLFIENADSPRLAAACVAAATGALMAVGILWAVSVLREPASHQGRGGARPYASFADVLRNRPARILLAVFFLEMVGYNAFVTILPYVTQYVLETPGSTAYYLFAAIATTLAGIPLWIRLSQHFGKARVWAVALAAKVAAFLGIAFVGPGDWLPIGVLTLVFGFTTGASVVLGPSLKADIVDLDEAETGERKEGTFFAAWNLAIKGAIGVSIALSGFVLSATGFRPNVAQSEDALLGIRMLVSFLPLASHVLAIALLARLELDESAHAVIRERIRVRRAGGIGAAAQAAACPAACPAAIGRPALASREES